MAAATLKAQMLVFPILLLTIVSAVSAEEPKPASSGDVVKVPSYQKQILEGWTVHVNDLLLKEEKVETEKALEFLTAQLKDIVRVVPADATPGARPADALFYWR